MTVILSPTPKQFFTTTAGVPLAGGFLYTYAAGTTTLLATYVDQPGITANANPIVLDTYGACDLWLSAGVAYKFVLKDSLGSLIWTVDNITSMGSLSLQNVDNVAISGGTIANVTIADSTFSGSATNVSGVVAIGNGGTGATAAISARANLGAAAKGANTDITSLASTTTINGTVIGYRDIPLNVQGGAYQLALLDAGKCIDITTGGVTIPANSTLAFPVGTAVMVYNDSAVNQTISIATDTLRQAGTANTGSRTLAQYGVCTLVKVGSTTWVISGAGVS